MAYSEGTFMLLMIAYFVPTLLVTIRIYFDGHSASANFESMINRTEFNQGLKALDLVMNVSSIARHHELRRL